MNIRRNHALRKHYGPSRIPLLFLGIGLLFCVVSVYAQDVPFLGGHVNDYAGILSSSTISELNWKLSSFEDSTSNQVVVLTINTLDGTNLEEYSVKVAQTWKLGQKGKDNGVLFLVVKDDRKIRIEVGYGLEGTLTDALCSVITQREIFPRFRNKDYDGGVKAGVASILAAINGTFTAERASGQHMGFPEVLIFLGIFTVVVGMFTFLALFTKGIMSWLLYLFLMPFWIAFPYAAIGGTIGMVPFLIYFIGFPIAKTWLGKSSRGISLQKVIAASMIMSSAGRGWGSSGGGWSSGGGGGFSGGGGSFGGGGSSGSW
jgi:uncharacterized protein